MAARSSSIRVHGQLDGGGLNNSTNPVQAVQAKLLGHTPYTSKVSIHCASVRSMSTMYNQPHPQKQVQQGTPSIFRQDSTIDQ